MRKQTRLILALDETDVARAMAVAEAAADQLDAIKVNWPLVLAGGPKVITYLAELAPVVCDFKVADIPNTNRLIAESAFHHGASGNNVHAITGRDSVQAVVEEAKGKEVFVVTEMSHPGGKEFTAPAADQLARVAVEAGATGVIAPATRPERIAHIRSLIGGRLILSPGVGAQGGSAADALRNGADYIIVGRGIYGDRDPRAAAIRYARQAREAL
ncbi:MAG: orotidine-5'-phosphate decarboxylase [Methanomassiliicoccales archaeon]|nr:orotidine-5'-phosphate decarboxylase [Methanomassiliicoccales archaeon]